MCNCTINESSNDKIKELETENEVLRNTIQNRDLQIKRTKNIIMWQKLIAKMWEYSYKHGFTEELLTKENPNCAVINIKYDKINGELKVIAVTVENVNNTWDVPVGAPIFVDDDTAYKAMNKIVVPYLGRKGLLSNF